MTREAMAEVTTNAAVRRGFSADPVDELVQPGQQPVAGVPAKIVVPFDSAAALESAVRGNLLPASTYAVLYDPEVWAFTPVAEQEHPVAAAAQAAATAHARGLRFIVAPALNLVKALSPRSHGGRDVRFLALRILGRMARHADVIDLQAQSLERNHGAYRAFVVGAAAQAHAGNPDVRVLAGLSTNPPGARVAVSELRGDIAATRSSLDGYWLNVPGRGARCPTCNAPQPQIAIGLTLRP